MLTIVIPTMGRPEYLPRAVGSALACAVDEDIEVIVVPNGPDQSWRNALSGYREHSALRILPIVTGHANAARNHGMRHAGGRYIRFLDDDDILYAEGVREQLRLLEQTGADLVSGNVDLADASGMIFGEWFQDATTDDFVAASCSHRRMLQMTAHVFRRAAIIDVPWDESLPYSQDICWVIDLLGKREFSWVKTSSKVGQWNRHVGARISTSASVHHRRRLIFERLQSLAIRLEQSGRMNRARRDAIADGVWEQVHGAFCLSPAYWWRVGKWAQDFCPASHPPIRFFESALVRRLPLSPLVWEAMISPKCWAKHSIKRVGHRLGLLRRW